MPCEHLIRGQTAQRTVRSEAVVIVLERLDLFLRAVERKEPIHIQTLITKAAVERLDERIIRRFSGPREVQRHFILVGPLVQRFGDELAAVVDLDALGDNSSHLFDPFHHVHSQSLSSSARPQSPDIRGYSYRLKLRPSIAARQTADR